MAAATAGGSILPSAAHADPRPSLASVQRQVTQLEHDSEVAAEAYHRAGEQADTARAKLVKVRAQVKDQEAALAKVQALVGQLAAATYRSGGADPTLGLLLSDDPNEAMTNAATLERVSAHQTLVLVKAARAKQLLAQDKAAVAAQVADLDNAEKARAAQDASARAKLAQARQLLASLQEDQRRRLAAAEAAAKARSEREARAARSELRTTPSAPARSSSKSPATSKSSATKKTSTSSAPTYSGPASGRAAIAVRTALAQVGDRYVYAGNGPDAFDCSGLTTYAWAAAGVHLPRSSSSQYAAGRKVAKSDLQPGDLVYYYSPISHVAMYIGGGKIVHAANPREGVLISSVDLMPYAGATRP